MGFLSNIAKAHGPIHLPSDSEDEKAQTLPTYLVLEPQTRQGCKPRALKIVFRLGLLFIFIHGIMHLFHSFFKPFPDLDELSGFPHLGHYDEDEAWNSMDVDSFDDDYKFDVECPAWPLDDLPKPPKEILGKPESSPNMPSPPNQDWEWMPPPPPLEAPIEFLHSFAQDEFSLPKPPKHPKHPPKSHGPPKAPFNSTLSFILPATSDLNSIVSKGRTPGVIAFVADSSIPKDEIHVNVTAKFWHPGALVGRNGKRKAFACKITSKDREVNKVVVFNKKPKHHHLPPPPPPPHGPPRHIPGKPPSPHEDFASFPPHSPPHPGPPPPRPPHRGPPRFPGRLPHPPLFGVFYEIVVRFPQSKDNVTALNSFQTDLPGFSHFVGKLKDKVSFQSVSFKSARTPIWVKSLSANTINAINQYGPIGGNFFATDSVHLASVDASIDAKIAISNGQKSSIHLETVHAPLDATISLDSSSTSITASNNAGPIKLDIPTLRENAQLNIDAANVVGPVDIGLPQEFEGRYTLQTTMAEATVELTESSTEGRGKVQDGKEEGSIRWSDQDGEVREDNVVSVQTELAPIKLVW